tara:strand:+ start:185759 stop:185986 length:228 start_codon:yes stop_codon:yes gene_type:complete
MTRSARRYYRTVLLGIMAMAALVWVAVDQFGISRQEITELFLTTVWVLGGVILVAAIATLCWVVLQRLFRNRDDQ